MPRSEQYMDSNPVLGMQLTESVALLFIEMIEVMVNENH
jgi:hypothetical protein